MTKGQFTSRPKSLTITGALVAGAGVLVALTLCVSSFSRYMYVEDLNPNVTPEVFRNLVAFSPGERGLFYIGVTCILLGLLLIVLGLARRRNLGH
jgi:tellurite resistance protein TehA-like permease